MISYFPTFIPRVIHVYGVGGTGSRLVPLLAQFIKTCPWVISPKIFLYDDDIVEPKNLLRQNFVAPDVDKKKAAVLAQRYSKAFDVDITPVDIRIGPNINGNITNLVKLVSEEDLKIMGENAIHLVCVDSPEARRSILKHILFVKGREPSSRFSYNRSAQNKKSFIIDAGNENDFGQIKICTGALNLDMNIAITAQKCAEELPVLYPVDAKISNIPVDPEYYIGMKAMSEGSCADLDQTLAINSLVANTMFGVVQNFYFSKPITFHRLNVSLSHGTTPEYITPFYFGDRTCTQLRELFPDDESQQFVSANYNQDVVLGSQTELIDLHFGNLRKNWGETFKEAKYRKALEKIEKVERETQLKMTEEKVVTIHPKPNPKSKATAITMETTDLVEEMKEAVTSDSELLFA